MAKGAIAKVEVGNKVLELFGGNAFWNGEGKEIRINTKENGEDVQIKLAFTVAKTPISADEVDAVPGVVKPPVAAVGGGPDFPEPVEKVEPVKIEVTETEREAVANLMSALGL